MSPDEAHLAEEHAIARRCNRRYYSKTIVSGQDQCEGQCDGSSRETPLSHAVNHGHVDVVWLLISQTDIILHHGDEGGMTPFLHAAKHGHATVVQMLLARLESPESLVEIKLLDLGPSQSYR